MPALTKNACFTQWVQVASRGPEWTVCPHGQVSQPKVSEEEPQFGGNGSVISGHGRVELIKKQKRLAALIKHIYAEHELAVNANQATLARGCFLSGTREFYDQQYFNISSK